MKLVNIFFYGNNEEIRTEIASITYSGIMKVRGLENTLKIIDYNETNLVTFLNNGDVDIKTSSILRATVDNDDKHNVYILFQKNRNTSDIILQIRHEVLGDLVHVTFREAF